MPFGAAHTCIAYIREKPPIPGGGVEIDPQLMQ